ncbi:cytochrome c oxidase subunit 7A2, mitochondrial [Eleutherodactylus coqui]|uniref:Cytochrome c oxidase subunit 7A2, mitochondrial n=1 Tax=Eleutherodactylus coqui TaxID=57060 RepID=A0A8J6FSB7_ELECQ|nr:hypothetical protein GDO78_001550 [Eleutherodactylus coqui]
MFRNLQALRLVSQRTFSSSTQKSLQNRVPERQKLFQEDNDLLIHVKGGFWDVIFYRITAVVVAIGGGISVYQLATYSQPKNK